MVLVDNSPPKRNIEFEKAAAILKIKFPVQYIRIENNKNTYMACRARNAGLKKCTGDLVFFMHDRAILQGADYLRRLWISSGEGVRGVGTKKIVKSMLPGTRATDSNKETVTAGWYAHQDAAPLKYLQMVGGFDECVPAGQNVDCLDNTIRIEDITKGVYVKTHTGEYNMVSETFVRSYQGDIITIKPVGMEPFSTTPEHPILCRFSETGRPQVDWIPAEKIVKLRSQYIRKPIHVVVSSLRTRNRMRSKILGGKKYLLNKDFLVFLGFYLAEGSVSRGNIELAFGMNESDVVDEARTALKNVTGKEPSLRPNGHGKSVRLRVWVGEPFTRELKEWVGGDSHTKHIPTELLLSPNDLRPLIRGYWLGDGSYNMKTHVFSASTVSQQLAITIKEALLRYGIFTSVSRYENGIHSYSPTNHSWKITTFQQFNKEMGAIFNMACLPSGHNSILRRTKLASEDKSRKNFYYYHIPIISVNKQFFSGKVHNLHVQNSNSYTLSGVVVHNCYDGDHGYDDLDLYNRMLVQGCEFVIEPSLVSFKVRPYDSIYDDAPGFRNQKKYMERWSKVPQFCIPI